MNKILIVSMSFLLLGAIILADDNDDLANTYYQSGLALQKDNKPNEAIEKFIKALSYKNDYPEAFFRLGECYEKLKDIPSAVKNYRLCVRCFENKTALNNEDKNVIQSAQKNLEKLDTKSVQIKGIKSKYIDKLSKIGSECNSKKYYNFTRRIYNLILTVDPNNKMASDALSKIPIDNSGGAPVEGQIFNGVDTSGWKINTNVWMNLWSVEKPSIWSLTGLQPAPNKPAANRASFWWTANLHSRKIMSCHLKCWWKRDGGMLRSIA